MLKFTKYILLACLALTGQACVKDLQDDINGGGWNHERTVLDIQFENQVGTATIETIDGSKGEVSLAINAAAVTDFSNIKLKKLSLSYQAKASLEIGEALNFENASNSASIVVTSATGEQREYVIHVSSFIESLVGDWAIEKLTVYGGTGWEYGGASMLNLANTSKFWSAETGPTAEYDNILTFEMTGVAEDGSTYGTCINSAGTDGKYADFIFLGAGNKDNPGVDVDLKNFYRQIPEGESDWVHDYVSKTVTFTNAAGKKTTLSFLGAGKETMSSGQEMVIENNAFALNLNGTDDWNNIYSEYDQLVKRPWRYWISITKK